ncbi:SDR family NAD(P)-dependent oxidoreductase [Nitrobacter sp.]|uniref:SDR family NAD(P)-dependent oxidoreductase n=1 Tax=Nitrobacter sp. TaxID=29420 RepID=UPI0029CABEC7|nr:SDR family NAD(P)-dependent oxidoreductase [Nitrobacter sp.]
MESFKGKSVLVTGGGSGIGKATALLLGQAGANVTVSDLKGGAAEDVAQVIVAAGGTAQGVAVDVSNEDQVEKMVGQAIDAYGRLDGAANCAGFPQHSVRAHELTLEQWNRCIAVNLTGAFLCAKYELQAMMEVGGGAIVTVASTAATRGFPLASEYAASKAGLLGFVRCAACEYGPLGIRINVVLPGGTDTPMLRGKMDEVPGLEALIAQQHMLRRFAQPIELGHAIRWLLSDEASFVTGVVFPVDGGQTAG